MEILLCILGVINASISILSFIFLLNNVYHRLFNSRKYIFYFTLGIAMLIRSVFQICYSLNILHNLSLVLIWIYLGDILFFIVYSSIIVIYTNLNYRLRAENNFNINAYKYLIKISPYIIVVIYLLCIIFTSESIFFILFDNNIFGSKYLIRTNLVGIGLLTIMYVLLFIIYIKTFISIYCYNNVIIKNRWRVSIFTTGIFLVSLCYFGRLFFNFYNLLHWKEFYYYPVSINIQVYMYILLETLPIIIILICITKVKKELLEIVKTKLHLRRENIQ